MSAETGTETGTGMETGPGTGVGEPGAEIAGAEPGAGVPDSPAGRLQALFEGTG